MGHYQLLKTTPKDDTYQLLAKWLEGQIRYKNRDESKGPPLLWTTIALSTITVVVVALRVYTRLKLLRFFGIDDYLNLCATIFALALSCMIIEGVRIGEQGTHTFITLEKGIKGVEILRKSAQFGFSLQILYSLSIGLSKAAVLFFLLRLQPTRNIRFAIYFLIVSSGLYSISTVAVSVFQCTPIGVQWEEIPFRSPYDNPRCINKILWAYIVPALNILFNILIFSLPISIVVKLDLPRRQRVGLALSFLLGLVACIASIHTLAYAHRLFKSLDPQFDSVEISLWIMAEAHMFIIGTNLPILRPLFTRLRRKFYRRESSQPLADSDADSKSSLEMNENENSFESQQKKMEQGYHVHEVDIGTAVRPEASATQQVRSFNNFRWQTPTIDLDYDSDDEPRTAHISRSGSRDHLGDISETTDGRVSSGYPFSDSRRSSGVQLSEQITAPLPVISSSRRQSEIPIGEAL